MAKYKSIEKCCATCWWSRRDYETLTLYCHKNPQQEKIKNAYEDAKTCNEYTFAKPKNTQLNLFT